MPDPVTVAGMTVVAIGAIAAAVNHNRKPLGNNVVDEARSSAGLGDYSQAAKLFEKALEINPNNPRAYSERAAMHLRMENWQEVIQDINIAVNLIAEEQSKPRHFLAVFFHPDHSEIFAMRAVALREQQRFDEALTDLNQAIRSRRRGNQIYYLHRGCTYYEMGEYNLALSDFNHSLKLQPTDFDALLWRSRILSQKRQFHKALASVNKALAVSPDNPQALIIRALCYVHSGQTELAVREAHKLEEKFPRSDATYHYCATIYFEAKMLETALEFCNRAISFNPNSALLFGGRAVIYADMEKWEQAIEDCNRSLKIDSQRTTVFAVRGLCHLKTGDVESAWQDCRNCLRINAYAPSGYRLRGLLHMEAKAWEEALADLSRSIELAPEVARAYRYRSEVYEKLGRHIEAQQDKQTFAELDIIRT